MLKLGLMDVIQYHTKNLLFQISISVMIIYM